jgi:PAS domain S-box-containing protein
LDSLITDTSYSEDGLRLKAIFETATDGIIIIDDRGAMELVNSAAAQLFGYDIHELIGQNVKMLMPMPHRRDHDGYISNYHQTGIGKIIGIGREVEGLKKDGSVFPFRLSISEVKLQDRKIFTGIVHDLTEQKKAEQALREEKEKAQMYFDLANTVNVVLDTSGQIVELNDKGCKLIGRPEAEVQGKSWFDLIMMASEKEKIRKAFCGMMREETEFMPYFETTVINNLQQQRYYTWHNNLIRGEKGEIIGMISSGIDITDRKFAEKALKKEKEKAQQYLDVANTIIVVISREEKITLLNKKGHEMLGYKEGELLGENWFESVLVPEERKEVRNHFYEMIHRQSEAGLPEYFESMVVTKRSQKRLIAWRNAVIYDDQGQIQATISSGVDITDQRAAEDSLKELNSELEERVEERTEELAEAVNQLLNINKQLEYEIQERKNIEDALRKNENELRLAYQKEKELSELKSRFVSMASHEFRTPLSTILSSADLIEAYKREEQQSKRERHTNRIKSSVANLTGILNDFLSLSKLEEGKIEEHPVAFNLEEFCEDVLDQMQGLLKRDQVIRHDMLVDPPTIILDKKLLKNVMFNLLSNAIKYSDAGTNIDCRVEKRGNTLIVVVVDEGIGIPAEEQQHLFTRFFRARNVENVQGTGLGLNIVKRYVELMRGSISFESKIGEGTTFTVFIPLDKAEFAEED